MGFFADARSQAAGKDHYFQLNPSLTWNPASVGISGVCSNIEQMAFDS